jgi:hypothetical protein
MFGDKRQYKKLAASGTKAPAEVTAAKEGVITTVRNIGTLGTKQWKVTATVRPENEPPFEATFERKVTIGQMVLVGSTTFVLYDPDDHSKVMEEQGMDGALDSIAARLSSKPGRGSTSDISAALKMVTENPKGYDKAALIEAIGGDATGVDQNTRFVNLTGAAPVVAGSPTAAPASAPTPAAPPAAASDDPVAKLTQLADLRDRGVLSYEEFETQKARILGETR